jgi:Zn-dependent protease
VSLAGWIACALAVPLLLWLLQIGLGLAQLRALRVRPRRSSSVDATAVPAALREAMQGGIAALTALGFTDFGWRRMPPLLDTRVPLDTYFVTASHPATGAVGAVVLSEAPEACWLWDVAYTSYLDDGRACVTTDARAHHLAPFREALALADGYTGDPAAAWATHRDRIAAGGVRCIRDPAELEAREEALMTAMFDAAVAGNRLLADGAGRYRLTWRGAIDFLRQIARGQSRRAVVLARRRAATPVTDDTRLLPAIDAQVMAALTWAAFAWTSETLFAALLLLTLALHEGGHYLAMRRFDYTRLKVFFVPFLGAAVSGHRVDAPAWQRVLIYLAGPVPGLVLGAALLASLNAALLPASTSLWLLAVLLVVLNLVNLLQLEPLDGGRIVSLLLCARHPRARTLLFAVGVGSLAALAYLTASHALGIFAALVALGLPGIHRQAQLLEATRQLALPADPRTALDLLCELVATMLPGLAYPQRYATLKDLLPDLRVPTPTRREIVLGGAAYLVALCGGFACLALLFGGDLLLVALGFADVSTVFVPPTGAGP